MNLPDQIDGTPAPTIRFAVGLKSQERLKRYEKKMETAANEMELSKTTRTLGVDVAAAARFIDAALPNRHRETTGDGPEASLPGSN